MADEELNKTINGLDPISSLSLETEFPVWDSPDEDTKKGTLQQVKDLIAEGIVAGVSFVGTRSQYETAKLIPAGEEGYIPDKSLVIITDEYRTYVTSGTGAEQTLTLIARVMSAGDGITITDDVIKADTVTFTGTRAEWELLSSSQKAKFNIVNFTDEELTDDVITNTVESGNMKAVTSNAVAGALENVKVKYIVVSGTSDTSGNLQIQDLPAGTIPVLFTSDTTGTDANYNVFYSSTAQKFYIHISAFGSGEGISSASIIGRVYYVKYF